MCSADKYIYTQNSCNKENKFYATEDEGLTHGHVDQNVTYDGQVWSTEVLIKILQKFWAFAELMFNNQATADADDKVCFQILRREFRQCEKKNPS